MFGERDERFQVGTVLKWAVCRTKVALRLRWNLADV